MTTIEPTNSEAWAPFGAVHAHWYAPSEQVSPWVGGIAPLSEQLDDSRRVEAAHRLVLEAEAALEGKRTRRRKAIARLVSARVVEKQVLNQLGFANYGEYKVTTDGRRAEQIARSARAEGTQGPRPFA